MAIDDECFCIGGVWAMAVVAVMVVVIYCHCQGVSNISSHVHIILLSQHTTYGVLNAWSTSVVVN